MAELVDAPDSKFGEVTLVRVRVPLWLRLEFIMLFEYAWVAELVDALVLGTSVLWRVGSSPSSGTIINGMPT